MGDTDLPNAVRASLETTFSLIVLIRRVFPEKQGKGTNNLHETCTRRGYLPWPADEVVALGGAHITPLATCSLGASLLSARGSSLMATELQ